VPLVSAAVLSAGVTVVDGVETIAMNYFNRLFGGLADVSKRTTKIRRPGAGPKLIAFSRAEVNALANYAVGYPLEEATDLERDAFNSGLDKIKARAEK
jgi:hypothetical protein